MGMVGKIIQGVTVNDETLAFDEIRSVRSTQYSYLDTAHTRTHYKDFWEPDIYQRKRFADWMDDGGKDLTYWAGVKTEKILKEHHPNILSKEQIEELERIAGG